MYSYFGDTTLVSYRDEIRQRRVFFLKSAGRRQQASHFMKRIIDVEVLQAYRVRLRFEDGVEGTADLSHLAGRGVFAAWHDYGFFGQATVGEHGRTLTWPGDLDLCADALWLAITGKQPEDLFPSLRRERPDYANP